MKVYVFPNLLYITNIISDIYIFNFLKIKFYNKKLPLPGIEPGFTEPQSEVLTTILQ